MAILETHELTRRFKTLTAVDSLTFSIEPGEVFGLLSPNGVGKTTTIKMLTTYPISIMPGWLQVVSRINPLSYEVDALRTLMLVGGRAPLVSVSTSQFCWQPPRPWS